MTPPRAWRCTLTLQAANRPGTLERIARVFAERGISLDAVRTALDGDAPTVELVFACGERLRHHLERRLCRLRDVIVARIEEA